MAPDDTSPPKYNREPDQSNRMDALDEALRNDLGRVSAHHPVAFAVVFGSATGNTEPNDIDLAVEFEEDVRTVGISDADLSLLTDLETALEFDVVLIDSMPPRFANVVLDEETVVVGSDDRREELAGEPPSTAEARDRVATGVGCLSDDDW